ncbi:hypothetical protein F444_15842 [Phytophthora nicotianae P1976]|nr:hypothetical protein F444_15842 [Phytophthora nicotianae P1976]
MCPGQLGWHDVRENQTLPPEVLDSAFKGEECEQIRHGVAGPVPALARAPGPYRLSTLMVRSNGSAVNF